jgi:hypothetical protein
MRTGGYEERCENEYARAQRRSMRRNRYEYANERLRV